MKKNSANTVNNTITNTTNNNNTIKEKKVMKNTNTNTNTNTNNANTLTLAGIKINLTPEQAATIAAMLLGGTAPTVNTAAPKKARSKKAVSEAVSADIVKAENASEDVTTAETHSTDQYEQLAGQYTDFKVAQDGNKLSFKTANGGFLYKKTPRYALNNRIKAVCADKGLSVEYSNDCWAWVVINPRTGKAPGKSVMTGIVNALSRPIEEHELQAVRDDWAAKKAAKAAKAAK